MHIRWALNPQPHPPPNTNKVPIELEAHWLLNWYRLWNSNFMVFLQIFKNI